MAYEVGQILWAEVKKKYGLDKRVERHLVTVVFIDKKGRGFICAESLWDKWRYGFDPETGTAKAYEFWKLQYASPEEVAAEQLRIQQIEEAEESERQTAIAVARIRQAAPDMAEALQAFVLAARDGEIELPVKQALAALAKAGL